MARFAHPVEVYRLRRSIVSHPYGGEPVFADWDDPEHLPEQVLIPDVAIAPGGSDTAHYVDRDQSRLDATLYAPSGVDIQPGDRILAGNDLYEVDGWVQKYLNPFTGWDPGTTIGLRKIRPSQ